MVSQTGPRVVRSNSCKGPVYPGKGPKKNQRAKKEPKGQTKFWGQQVLFGTIFLKLGSRRANLATLVHTSYVGRMRVDFLGFDRLSAYLQLF